MKFKILGCGTSTGVPIPGCRCRVCTSDNDRNHRSRTSALVRVSDSFNILIDTTTDLRYQALKWHVDSVNAVLFTHAHADHIMGMDDLRGYNYIQKSRIPCYGSESTLTEIRRCFSYIFNPDQDYEGGIVPQLALTRIEDYKPFNVGNINVQPFNLLHGKTHVTGFRFGELAYATDCNFIPEQSKQILEGVKTLFIDGLRHEPHKTHFTISEAIEAARELKVERTFLIHMTHSIDYDEVSAQLPEDVFLAYDGLEIDF